MVGALDQHSIFGLTIIPHELAYETKTQFKVAAWATRDKKRKNWRVMRVETKRPACFQAGSNFYVHPELVAKLKGAMQSALASKEGEN